MIVWRTHFSRLVLRTVGAIGAVLLIFILGFSLQAYRWGLGRYGLEMTVLSVGTCMLVAASAQIPWKSPGVLGPLLTIGQYSYEIYLTHMFVVFSLFNLFVSAGKPMRLVPLLFIAVILVSGVLGGMVARFYSEPMNGLLRSRSLFEPRGHVPAVDAQAENSKRESIPGVTDKLDLDRR